MDPEQTTKPKTGGLKWWQKLVFILLMFVVTGVFAGAVVGAQLAQKKPDGGK